MRIAVSTDKHTQLTAIVAEELKKRDHTLILFGPIVEAAAADGGSDVDQGAADWSVMSERAALCADAETARGARKWNHANAPAISLRATSEAVA